MSNNTCLIQFAKAPTLGSVKTRLSPVLNQTQRNELHCAMTEWTCQQLCKISNSRKQLWVAGDTDHGFIIDLSNKYDIELRKQVGEGLGERMSHACREGLDSHEKTLIVGSDCPFLNSDLINTAIDCLETAEFVFIPANDGGYVLLAMRVFEPKLFQNIAWGSDQVLKQSIDALEMQSRIYKILSPLPDIDRPEDLKFLDDSKLPLAIQGFSKYKKFYN